MKNNIRLYKIIIRYWQIVTINITVFILLSYILLLLVEFYYYKRENTNVNNRGSASPNEIAAEKLGVPYDSRGLRQVIRDYRKKQIIVYPYFHPSIFIKEPIILNNQEYIPLSGISSALTVFCNESGQYPLIKTDKFGFNNSDEAYQYSEGLEMALIGDSFAFGYCVDQSETIASILRQYNSCVSFGSGGGGPLSMLGVIKEYFPILKPRNVYWLYFEGNDLDDLMNEMNNSLLINYLDDEYTQDLISNNVLKDEYLINYATKELEKDAFEGGEKTRNYGSIIVLSRIRTRYSNYRLRKKSLELLPKILLTAKEELNNIGAELIFVYLPQWERYGDIQRTNQYREQVLTIVNNLDLKIIDIHLKFSMYQDALSLFPFNLRNHYTSEAYKIIANVIIDEHKKSATSYKK
ncbi:hypothetical protein E3V33_00070 [Candidatus Marinimicrobia bacterium MT.SAG.4]|nr:hypothetical protein E3V33_00070 [Candidatus Marinimicrobia bacterium MT.SAG.4]